MFAGMGALTPEMYTSTLSPASPVTFSAVLGQSLVLSSGDSSTSTANSTSTPTAPTTGSGTQSTEASPATQFLLGREHIGPSVGARSFFDDLSNSGLKSRIGVQRASGYSRLTDARSFVRRGAPRSRSRTGCSASPRSIPSAKAPRTCSTKRRWSPGSLRALEASSAARKLR